MRKFLIFTTLVCTLSAYSQVFITTVRNSTPATPTDLIIGNPDETLITANTGISDARMQELVMPENGWIDSVAVWHDGVTQTTSKLGLAVYSDNAGTPDQLLGVTRTASQVVAGWNKMPLIKPVYVTSGSTIWVGFGSTNITGGYWTGAGGNRSRTGVTFGSDTGIAEHTLFNVDYSELDQAQFDYALYATYKLTEPTTDGKLYFVTESRHPTWTVNNITKTGGTLTWTATGYDGTNYGTQNVNKPSFDFSGNTGDNDILIEVSSPDGWSGLTLLDLWVGGGDPRSEGSWIRYMDIRAASSLTFLQTRYCHLAGADLSQQTLLTDFIARGNYQWYYGLDLSGMSSLNTFQNDVTRITDGRFVFPPSGAPLDNIDTYDIHPSGGIQADYWDTWVILADAGGQTGGDLRFLTEPDANLTEASYSAYQSLIGKSWTIDLPSPPSPSIAQLSNFRVDDTNLDRVLFDASASIAGMTQQGFIISGKTLETSPNGLVIDGDNLGGYFDVTVAFDFWDNNTIRLESGDGTVNDFYLEHIQNLIDEPTPTRSLWVDASVSSSGDGLTEVNAKKTIQEAISIAQAGDIIHIKAGIDYAEAIDLNNEVATTASSPLILEGYVSTAGDLNGVDYYTYSAGVLSPTAAPLSTGTSASNGILLGASGVTTNSKFIIIRNMQLEGWNNNIISNGGGNYVIDNCVVREADIGASDYGINLYAGGGDYTRITNTTSINAGAGAIKAYDADFLLVENCETYGENGGGSKMDYYFTFFAKNSIFKNNLSRKILNDGDNWEHGFSLAGDNVGDTEYNLLQDNEVWGMRGPELRRGGAAYNVVRGQYTHDTSGGTGIQIRDGSNNNVIEGSYFVNLDNAIDFSSSTEAGTGSGYSNLIRNNIAYNVNHGIYARATDATHVGVIQDNQFYNNTFYGTNDIWIDENATETITWTNNTLTNNIIYNFSAHGDETAGQTYSNNDFFNSWQTLVGSNGNINIDPNFVNPAGGDFRPQATFTDIDAARLTDADRDYNNANRNNPTTIGAVKHLSE